MSEDSEDDELSPEHILASDLWHMALGLYGGGFEEFSKRIIAYRDAVRNEALDKVADAIDNMTVTTKYGRPVSVGNFGKRMGDIIRHAKTPSKEAEDE